MARRRQDALNRGSYSSTVGRELQSVTAATMQHAGWLTDVPGTRVTVLASMALLSVLAAREAVGHAQTGDRGAAVAAIGEARRWLDHGRRGDEPFWLNFWGPADLAWHETRVALVGRNGKSAEVAARAALTSSDADAFPRNHVVYTVDLASVLTQLGQLDEAISVTSNAIHGVQEIRGSGLILADLRRIVDLLGQQKYLPTTNFATAARQLLPASR